MDCQSFIAALYERVTKMPLKHCVIIKMNSINTSVEFPLNVMPPAHILKNVKHTPFWISIPVMGISVKQNSALNSFQWFIIISFVCQKNSKEKNITLYLYVLRAVLKHVPSWNMFQIGMVRRFEKCAFLKYVLDWPSTNFVISRADDNMSLYIWLK